MQKLVRARVSLNKEKRTMSTGGTAYRKKTAIYASHLMNDLLSLNINRPINRAELVTLSKSKFNVNDERASDIAKSIDVHLKSCEDQDRLAKYYKQVDEIMSNRNIQKGISKG